MPARPAANTLTIQLDPETQAELDALARVTSRDSSLLAAEAIETYLAAHRAETTRIREGLRQADAGTFAGDEEVAAAFAAWG